MPGRRTHEEPSLDTPAGAFGNAAAPTVAATGPAAAAVEPVPRTRASHTWVGLAAGLVILVVVLVFILENLQSVKVSFFGATWHAPLAVDLLLATVLGALVVFTVGSARILQLRRTAKRNAAATR